MSLLDGGIDNLEPLSQVCKSVVFDLYLDEHICETRKEAWQQLGYALLLMLGVAFEIAKDEPETSHCVDLFVQ